MKINKPLLAALGIVTVCATGSAVALAANSDAGQGTQTQEKSQYYSAVEEAIENNDYSAWLEAINSRPRITDYINEDNFDRYIEMQRLLEEGNTDEANVIREELGLPDGHISGMGIHGKRGSLNNSTGERSRDGSCNDTDSDAATDTNTN